jgi:hypothetical protein
LRGKKVNDHGKENKKDFISSSFFSYWTQQLQRQKKKGKEKSFSFHQILRKKNIEKSRIKERLREIKRDK